MNKYKSITFVVVIFIALSIVAAYFLIKCLTKSNSVKASNVGYISEKPNMLSPNTAYKAEMLYDPDGSMINLENLDNILNLDIETASERYQAAENPINTMDVSYLNSEIGGFQPIGLDDNAYQNINPKSTFCHVFKQEWANKNANVQDVELDNMMKTSQAFNCDWNDFKKIYCGKKPALSGVRDYGCDPSDYPSACKSLIQTYGMLSPNQKLEQYDTYKQNSRLLRCMPKAIDKLFCRSIDVKDGVVNFGCNPEWYL